MLFSSRRGQTPIEYLLVTIVALTIITAIYLFATDTTTKAGQDTSEKVYDDLLYVVVASGDTDGVGLCECSNQDNDGDEANAWSSSSSPDCKILVPDLCDCKDNNDQIYPGASESCDDKDNDCDGQTDEGCP